MFCHGKRQISSLLGNDKLRAITLLPYLSRLTRAAPLLLAYVNTLMLIVINWWRFFGAMSGEFSGLYLS